MKINKVYREHNPEKLDEVLELLKTKRRGKEMKYYQMACAKYGATEHTYPEAVAKLSPLEPFRSSEIRRNASVWESVFRGVP